VAQIMAAKARVKLNLKQLYRADGFAVKEMLKISSLLYDALQAQQLDDGTKLEATDFSLSSKVEELKEARALATDIVESGAKLYSLLEREDELKDARERALKFVDSISLNLDSDETHQLIEKSIREQINNVTDNIGELEKQCAELEKDQKGLKAKIERKAAEIERGEKRLKSMKKVRPAFMDEYDAMEAEMKRYYDTYVEKCRKMHYLESELAKRHRADGEKRAEADRALKLLQKRLRADELAVLRGEHEVDENEVDDAVYDSGREDGGRSDDVKHPSRKTDHGQRGKNGSRATAAAGGGSGGRTNSGGSSPAGSDGGRAPTGDDNDELTERRDGEDPDALSAIESDAQKRPAAAGPSTRNPAVSGAKGKEASAAPSAGPEDEEEDDLSDGDDLDAGDVGGDDDDDDLMSP